MSQQKLVSVDEYARMKGVSKSHIYSLMKGSLADRVVKKNGTKFIDISDRADPEQEKKTSNEKQQTPAQQAESKEEVEKKEEQQSKEAEYKAEIERLQKELETEREYSRTKDNKMMELMEKVLELTENTQKLTARVQEQQVMLQQKEQHPILITDGTEKKSWFSRFKRKK